MRVSLPAVRMSVRACSAFGPEVLEAQCSRGRCRPASARGGSCMAAHGQHAPLVEVAAAGAPPLLARSTHACLARTAMRLAGTATWCRRAVARARTRSMFTDVCLPRRDGHVVLKGSGEGSYAHIIKPDIEFGSGNVAHVIDAGGQLHCMVEPQQHARTSARTQQPSLTRHTAAHAMCSAAAGGAGRGRQP